MLELRKYTRAEMAQILGTNNLGNMKRKLTGYDVAYQCEGPNNRQTFTITAINRPFKVYAITELGCDANTDFLKLAYFLCYFFNDDTFSTMPDEVKAVWMIRTGHQISRQTITSYTNKLNTRDLVYRDIREYLYYFAYQSQQTFTDYATYRKAWAGYWEMVNGGCHSGEAIYSMICEYGGVARKQPVMTVNGIYCQEIEYLGQLIQAEIERDAVKEPDN